MLSSNITLERALRVHRFLFGLDNFLHARLAFLLLLIIFSEAAPILRLGLDLFQQLFDGFPRGFLHSDFESTH